MFYKYLQKLDKYSLASQVFEEQTKMKFPGLSKECLEIAEKLGIYNEIQNKNINYNQFKNIAKDKIEIYNEKLLKEEMKELKNI